MHISLNMWQLWLLTPSVPLVNFFPSNPSCSQPTTKPSRSPIRNSSSTFNVHENPSVINLLSISLFVSSCIITINRSRTGKQKEAKKSGRRQEGTFHITRVHILDEGIASRLICFFICNQTNLKLNRRGSVKYNYRAGSLCIK